VQALCACPPSHCSVELHDGPVARKQNAPKIFDCQRAPALSSNKEKRAQETPYFSAGSFTPVSKPRTSVRGIFICSAAVTGGNIRLWSALARQRFVSRWLDTVIIPPSSRRKFKAASSRRTPYYAPQSRSKIANCKSQIQNFPLYTSKKS
jgi:hypothetical protein